MTVTTIDTQLVYYPQANFTVLAVPTPIGVSLPAGATLTPIPDELVNKPVSYDFENHVWVDKSDDAEQKRFTDLQSALDNANTTIATQIQQLANQSVLLSTQEAKITALSSQLATLVMQSANTDSTENPTEAK